MGSTNQEAMGIEANALLTSKEAAQMLAVSERTLWSIKASGELPFVQIGRSVRYNRSDLQHYVEQQTRGRGR